MDYSSKIRIELPKPVLATGQAKNEQNKATGSQGNLLAPDKGDVFDSIAACQEADRLITECKTKNLGTDKPWEVWEASESVCKIAIEWQNFCRKQN